MLPIRNVTYTKCYLDEMLLYENVLYEMLLYENVLYEMLLYENVLYEMLLIPRNKVYKLNYKSDISFSLEQASSFQLFSSGFIKSRKHSN